MVLHPALIRTTSAVACYTYMQQTVANIRLFIRVRRVLSIFGIILYPVVLWVLRPSYTGDHPLMLILLGSLPHFLAGFLLPVSALKPELMIQYPRQYHQVYLMISAGVMGFLVLEEFVPIFSPTGVLDPYDIVFGLLGIVVAYVLYIRFFRPLVRPVPGE